MNLHDDARVIAAMGGPTAVARLVGVRPQSVSAWRHDGIPRARRMYLELLRPDAFCAAAAAKCRPAEADGVSA